MSGKNFRIIEQDNTKEEKKILEYYKKGKTPGRIGREMNINPIRIIRILKKYEVYNPRRKYNYNEKTVVKSIRFPVSLYEHFCELSEEGNVSVNGFIIETLKKEVKS